ncbi:dnaJ homolog subfamily C member 2 [Carica papaya]|uniref:dnaJ homolog subfamily C member 2 n=1 Tax=Carica papaya TaxID=3649 RepID=UPI000B8D0E92|nr:dnaJ homolog subfamily C member 2 [Carica papaya]
MEFLDEDARPRFLYQSRPVPSSPHTDDQNPSKPNRLYLSIFLSICLLLFFLSLFCLHNEPFKSLLIWISLSFLLGPFAPSSLTGGHIRVGHGPILEQEFPDLQTSEIDSESKKKPVYKRTKPQRFEYPLEIPSQIVESANKSLKKDGKSEYTSSDNVLVRSEEEEWSEEDMEMLKKQLLKNPVGKPGRWEVIAKAFKGRYRVETVIKKAKEMGEKKLDDSDAYARFLKNRKPLDTKIHETADDGGTKKENGRVGDGSEWSSGEDIALLNALKAFPKDVPMRWEKIEAAVPGKSKAACVKRVAELKRDFRSGKAGAES